MISGQIAGIAGRAEVPVFGAHNVTNLMAACAYALAARMEPEAIWAALPECRTAWGRNQWVSLKCGARALFDAYNANPESMRAAIENFSKLGLQGGRKFAAFGEMREMGEHAESVHEELGKYAGQAGFTGILFTGASRAAFERGLMASGFDKTVFISDTYEQNLALQMAAVLHSGDIVLL